MNHQFSVIVDLEPKDNDEILSVMDTFGQADCLDASISGHDEGIEAIFNREAASLDAAIKSAVTAIEAVGFRVKRIELARESIILGT